MEDKRCDVCAQDTKHKTIKTTTPQGWPMVIDECQKCKLRLLLNDPEADAKKEA